jgi:CRP-like cAMP-binding protein
MSEIYRTFVEKSQKIFTEIQKIESLYGRTIVRETDLKRNTFLHKEAVVCNDFFFVKSGILRTYYSKMGVDIIIAFTFPGDIATSFRSILMHEPSKYSVQAVTDCAVYSISIREFEKLKQEFPVIQQLSIELTELYALWLEDRICTLQFQTAKEKYNELLQHDSQMLRSIPLTFIASYLGITLETLSRIRAAK